MKMAKSRGGKLLSQRMKELYLWWRCKEDR